MADRKRVRFVGYIAANLVDRLSFSGLPKTRAQQLEVTKEHVQIWLPQLRGIPIRMNHTTQPVGKVVRASLDDEHRLSVEFELDESLGGKAARELLRGGTMRQLSLSHDWIKNQPLEVSLCEEGARPNTDIHSVVVPFQPQQLEQMDIASINQLACVQASKGAGSSGSSALPVSLPIVMADSSMSNMPYAPQSQQQQQQQQQQPQQQQQQQPQQQVFRPPYPSNPLPSPMTNPTGFIGGAIGNMSAGTMPSLPVAPANELLQHAYGHAQQATRDLVMERMMQQQQQQQQQPIPAQVPPTMAPSPIPFSAPQQQPLQPPQPPQQQPSQQQQPMGQPGAGAASEEDVAALSSEVMALCNRENMTPEEFKEFQKHVAKAIVANHEAMLKLETENKKTKQKLSATLTSAKQSKQNAENYRRQFERILIKTGDQDKEFKLQQFDATPQGEVPLVVVQAMSNAADKIPDPAQSEVISRMNAFQNVMQKRMQLASTPDVSEPSSYSPPQQMQQYQPPVQQQPYYQPPLQQMPFSTPSFGGGFMPPAHVVNASSSSSSGSGPGPADPVRSFFSLRDQMAQAGQLNGADGVVFPRELLHPKVRAQSSG